MNKQNISELIALLEREKAAGVPPSPPPPPLNYGGEGGRFDPMEPRVAKLEAHMENVRAEVAKLGSLPADMATLKERVSHLPGKGFVVTAALTTITGVVGLIALLQKIGLLT